MSVLKNGPIDFWVQDPPNTPRPASFLIITSRTLFSTPNDRLASLAAQHSNQTCVCCCVLRQTKCPEGHVVECCCCLGPKQQFKSNEDGGSSQNYAEGDPQHP